MIIIIEYNKSTKNNTVFIMKRGVGDASSKKYGCKGEF